MLHFGELGVEEQERVLEVLSGEVTVERWELMQRVISERTRHLTVVLEDIYQGHNAAAVVRSCDGFGVQDLHVIEKRNVLNLGKSTVSKGAYKWLDIHYYRDKESGTGDCIQALKEKGYRIGATALGQNSLKVEEIPLDKPVALMIGTEMTGLTEEAIEGADFCVELPMYGFTQSYNLSVCAALCLHHLTWRMRQEEVTGWGLEEAEKRETLYRWLRKCVGHADEVLARM